MVEIYKEIYLQIIISLKLNLIELQLRNICWGWSNIGVKYKQF